jgi:hypothetical protein
MGPGRQHGAIKKHRQEHEASAWIKHGAALQRLRRFDDAVAARERAPPVTVSPNAGSTGSHHLKKTCGVGKPKIGY